MSEWLIAGRSAGAPRGAAADALRLCQPRPHRHAAGPGRSAPQPLSRRRHRGAGDPPGARTQPRGHRRKRHRLGRAGDRHRRSRPSCTAASSIAARTPLRSPSSATLEETAALLWASGWPVSFRRRRRRMRPRQRGRPAAFAQLALLAGRGPAFARPQRRLAACTMPRTRSACWRSALGAVGGTGCRSTSDWRGAGRSMLPARTRSAARWCCWPITNSTHRPSPPVSPPRPAPRSPLACWPASRPCPARATAAPAKR